MFANRRLGSDPSTNKLPFFFAPFPYSFGLLKYKSDGRISDLTKPAGRTLFGTNHD
jgi:hypothetical protein